MPYQFLILQHGNRQGPGRIFLDLAVRLSIHLHVVDLHHQVVPDFPAFDALIVLGGATSEESSSPFFEEEKRILQAWLALDRPCIGLGRGHLLFADVMGATIGPNFSTSIGFTPGHLTHDGRSHPLFRGIDTPFALFKWHDTSIQTPVPRNILLLATSHECVVEAFCVRGRPHIIGLQFENHEAHPDDVADRVFRENGWLEQNLQNPGGIELLLRDARRYRQEIEEKFALVMENFIGLMDK